MTPAELLSLLLEFYRETLDLLNARQTNAQLVTGYDANNAYQQVIGRQDVHLQWLADAITSLGGSVQDAFKLGGGMAAPRGGGSPIESDVVAQRGFIERWSPRVKTATNARNRKMLELIIGEMKEHLRVLQQAADGRPDVLGRHSDGKILRGAVLPARPQN